MDESNLAGYATRHRQALSLGVPLMGAPVTFFLFGGLGAGWGNVLAAGVLAVALWIGMRLVLYWLTLGTASHDIPAR
jgi:hypothetical protein